MAGPDGANGLRQLRKDRGLTLEALGLLAGVTFSEISKIERGLTRPRAETIVRLSKALKIGVGRMQRIIAASAQAAAESEQDHDRAAV